VSERKDLSPYIVHLTRDLPGADAPTNLISILASRRIEARTAYGIAMRHIEPMGLATPEVQQCQKVVCFSETPPDDLHGLIDPGMWRQYHFKPYGVAFERAYVLGHGGNAVWYVNSYINDREWLAKSINALIDAAAKGADSKAAQDAFIASPTAQLTPFIEVIGQWGPKKKDFSFEREWRHLGDFSFNTSDIAAVITPPGEQGTIRGMLSEHWGDQNIGNLVFRELTEADASALPESP
jgi:hypothetical protein